MEKEKTYFEKEAPVAEVCEENLYRLNGRVPLRKAIPFGLQHVLAMFVANLAPVMIVCGAAIVQGTQNHLTAAEITQILQCAMFAAGIRHLVMKVWSALSFSVVSSKVLSV